MNTISDLQGNIYEFNLKLSSNKNTIKIIDLLNKIAKGEEVPNKIKWGVHNFEWFVYEYRANDEMGKPTLLDYVAQCPHSLNDEVEIIEEDKEIEKIKWNEKSLCQSFMSINKADEMLMSRSEQLKKSLNELIDEVNKLKRGDE